GGATWPANPDLDPETSTNREIGISFDNDLIDVGVTYFHTEAVLHGRLTRTWIRRPAPTARSASASTMI
ncbi:hypothetical protein C7E18_24100, partial [Stenotrophomonas maltophilia]